MVYVYNHLIILNTVTTLTYFDSMREDTAAYDQAITVFSPEGRLYQVEYAREAVKRGATGLGLKYKSGLVMVVEKRIQNRLIEADSIKKLFKLTDNIGCTSSGLVADTQVLVDYMRQVAQLNKIQYNEPITILELVKKLSNLNRSFTQFGSGRPFGVAFLIGGTDHTGIHLFETDVSGAYQVYDAGCIGQDCQLVNEFFENEYKDDMNQHSAIKMGIEAMQLTMKDPIEAESIDILIIEKEKGYTILERTEIKKHL